MPARWALCALSLLVGPAAGQSTYLIAAGALAAPLGPTVTQVPGTSSLFTISRSDLSETLTLGPSAFIREASTSNTEVVYVLTATCPYTTAGPSTTSTISRLSAGPLVLSGWPASCTEVETVYLSGTTTSGTVTMARGQFDVRNGVGISRQCRYELGRARVHRAICDAGRIDANFGQSDKPVDE